MTKIDTTNISAARTFCLASLGLVGPIDNLVAARRNASAPLPVLACHPEVDDLFEQLRRSGGVGMSVTPGLTVFYGGWNIEGWGPLGFRLLIPESLPESGTPRLILFTDQDAADRLQRVLLDVDPAHARDLLMNSADLGPGDDWPVDYERTAMDRICRECGWLGAASSWGWHNRTSHHFDEARLRLRLIAQQHEREIRGCSADAEVGEPAPVEPKERQLTEEQHRDIVRQRAVVLINEEIPDPVIRAAAITHIFQSERPIVGSWELAAEKIRTSDTPARRVITRLFRWGATPEGPHFWRGVSQALGRGRAQLPAHPSCRGQLQLHYPEEGKEYLTGEVADLLRAHLPSTIAVRAVRNYHYSHAPCSEYEIDGDGEVLEDLIRLGTWAASAEGGEYWQDLVEKLDAAEPGDRIFHPAPTPLGEATDTAAD